MLGRDRGTRAAVAAACGMAAVLAAAGAGAQQQPVVAGGAPPARPATSRHRGGLAMPFVGMHSVRGDAGRGLDAGLRAGLLAGGYALGQFSFNGEVVLDWANPSSSGADVTAFTGDAAFSPLYHHALGNVELIAGPKLGYFYSYAHTDLLGTGITTTGRGLTLGINAGVLFAASPAAAFGVLLSYQFRDPSKVCTTTGSVKVCGTGGDAANILGLNAAVLF